MTAALSSFWLSGWGAPVAPPVEPTFPIRAAFYYPWFTGGNASYPGAWTQQGLQPFTRYVPSRGFYNSADQSVIDGHLADLAYAKVKVGISSWWGRTSRENGVLPTLLARAAALYPDFRWCVYYESEGNVVAGATGSPDPTSAQITADLDYLTATYTSHPSYLRIGGKPVVFAYGGPEDGTQAVAQRPAARWAAAVAAAAEPWYTSLKVYSGYASEPSQPSSWHQYGPASARADFKPRSFTISPGYYKANEAEVLPRDPARWRSDIQAMIASAAQWQLITSFNEWGEGHPVESATAWASASGRGTYLDVLATDGRSTAQGRREAYLAPVVRESYVVPSL